MSGSPTLPNYQNRLCPGGRACLCLQMSLAVGSAQGFWPSSSSQGKGGYWSKLSNTFRKASDKSRLWDENPHYESRNRHWSIMEHQKLFSCKGARRDLPAKCSDPGLGTPVEMWIWAESWWLIERFTFLQMLWEDVLSLRRCMLKCLRVMCHETKVAVLQLVNPG